MAKFRLEITNHSHVIVEADSAEEAKTQFEAQFGFLAEGPSREQQDEIFENSTHWFVDGIKPHEE